MPPDLRIAVERLAARRAEIEAEQRLGEAARGTVELDQQAVGRLSRIDALQAQAMAEAQQRKRRLELVRIELAERRIENGDYGYCAECGQEIADGRLAIDPMAERCIRCA